MSNPSSLYARLGGAVTLDQLASRLYVWMREMPEAAAVHAMHQMSMDQVETRLRAFLSAFFGGPDEYRANYGEPMMRRRHLAFPIGPAERDAWLACMQRALAEVVADATLRAEAYAQIAAFAERMRNRDASGATAHGPGLAHPGGRPLGLRIISSGTCPDPR
jgi:hemoglobin